jgi:hypothetical protein
LTGIVGGDYWLDNKVLKSVFSKHGIVLDVFLPKSKKVRLCSGVGVLHCSRFSRGGRGNHQKKHA